MNFTVITRKKKKVLMNNADHKRKEIESTEYTG